MSPVVFRAHSRVLRQLIRGHAFRAWVVLGVVGAIWAGAPDGAPRHASPAEPTGGALAAAHLKGAPYALRAESDSGFQLRIREPSLRVHPPLRLHRERAGRLGRVPAVEDGASAQFASTPPELPATESPILRRPTQRFPQLASVALTGERPLRAASPKVASSRPPAEARSEGGDPPRRSEATQGDRSRAQPSPGSSTPVTSAPASAPAVDPAPVVAKAEGSGLSQQIEAARQEPDAEVPRPVLDPARDPAGSPADHPVLGLLGSEDAAPGETPIGFSPVADEVLQIAGIGTPGQPEELPPVAVGPPDDLPPVAIGPPDDLPSPPVWVKGPPVDMASVPASPLSRSRSASSSGSVSGQASPVPEPSTGLLLCLGLAFLATGRRRH